MRRPKPMIVSPVVVTSTTTLCRALQVPSKKIAGPDGVAGTGWGGDRVIA
jgi:hypothetical protein